MQAWNDTTTNNSDSILKPKIAIAIPYIGDWNPEWVQKTRDQLMIVGLPWCYKIQLMSKVPSLPVSRDLLVQSALKANADYIFFVDSDNIFESPENPNDALYSLYQALNKNKNTKDGKIISGLYRAKQKVGFNYAAWMKAPDGQKGYTSIFKWTGNYIEVDAVGLGCCLIDMNTFKELQRPWFRWELEDDISEDFYFLEQAKKYGYNTHVFTDVKLSHLGNLKVKCDGTIVIQDM